MTKIVDTHNSDYQLIEGKPFTDYRADEEFIYQMDKYFYNLFDIEVISKKGSGNTRYDVLLKMNFKGEQFSGNVFYVYVFILYEGGAGRTHNDELRTQLTAHSTWNPDLKETRVATHFRDNSESDLSNKECYCLGIYKQDLMSHNVAFVGIPAEILCKSENEKINPTSTFQTYGSLVRDAFLKGVVLHKKSFHASNTFNEILFIPKNFLWYMKHRDELHLEDINVANSIIEKQQIVKEHSYIPNVEIEKLKIMPYLTAIRTKPFVLLAGISGTGKSRIVRKLAQATVSEELQVAYGNKYTDFEKERWNIHKPENFEIIQVKPNWHNSMDVVGYLSNIPEPHYVFTPFVEFIIKAMKYPTIPFFLCLDEMNLAPVEEYFAEFLSAIESRSYENGVYSTDPIIKSFDSFGNEVCNNMIRTFFPEYNPDKQDNENEYLIDRLKNQGLMLPQNLIVIGTVNMDETTFSFSRKVLDRAMSIEMNDVDYDSYLNGTTDNELKSLLETFDAVELNSLLVERPVNSSDVIGELGHDDENSDSKFVIDYLKRVNSLLDGTPFKLGYRAANEALLYLSASYKFNSGDRVKAMDNFTLMKILSRIEGDQSKLKLTDSKVDTERLEKAGVEIENAKNHGELTILTAMRELIKSSLLKYPDISSDTRPDNQETHNADSLNSIKKIDSMISQLERDHFVSYWN